MKTNVLPLAALALSALAVVAAADTAGDHHLLDSGKSVKWGAPPPILPAGAKFAVIDGDPAGKGLVTVRLKMPAGYKIPPHWHPTDEHVTVLAGSLGIGMGDTLDPAHGQDTHRRWLRRGAGHDASLRVDDHGRDHPGAPGGPVRAHLRQPGRRSEQERQTLADRPAAPATWPAPYRIQRRRVPACVRAAADARTSPP